MLPTTHLIQRSHLRLISACACCEHEASRTLHRRASGGAARMGATTHRADSVLPRARRGPRLPPGAQGSGTGHGCETGRSAPMTVSPGRPELGKPEPQAGGGAATGVDPAEIEPDAQAMTRIVLRPIGSPLPLGYFTV